MTPQRFQQIRNLFEAALERHPVTRSSFLEEACRDDEPLRLEVERLLAAHQKEVPLLDQSGLRDEPRQTEPQRINPYEILREGRGGMQGRKAGIDAQRYRQIRRLFDAVQEQPA